MHPKKLLPIAFLLLFIKVDAQLSIRAPEICHDNAGFLNCYNDGTFKIYFDKGKFTQFMSVDSTFTYSVNDNKISFLANKLRGPGDRIQLQLLTTSIVVTKGTKKFEILSLKQDLSGLSEFRVFPYGPDDFVKGISFYVSGKCFEIKVWDEKGHWAWDIFTPYSQPKISIFNNAYRYNPVGVISIKDDSLRYGMTVSSTFKNSGKLWVVESYYSEKTTDSIKNISITRSVPLDNAYLYVYRKNGKLNVKKSVGPIKECRCE